MIQASSRSDEPPVASVSPPPAHFAYDVTKRALDLVVAAVLLLALAPVLIVTALLIRVTSRGPIFFTHERLGRGGEPIRVYKFRTMVPDADRRAHEAHALTRARGLHVVDGPVFKSADDPRVTPLGRVLRRFSLDELPQLFNVVGGSMSLVGPRPLVHEEVLTLTPTELVRQSVKPGITCIWQVSPRSRVGFRERMGMDVEYVQRRSVAFDAWLLLKTPFAAIAADGAY